MELTLIGENLKKRLIFVLINLLYSSHLFGSDMTIKEVSVSCVDFFKRSQDIEFFGTCSDWAHVHRYAFDECLNSCSPDNKFFDFLESDIESLLGTDFDDIEYKREYLASKLFEKYEDLEYIKIIVGDGDYSESILFLRKTILNLNFLAEPVI